MHLSGGPGVMANWPLEWKLGSEALAGIIKLFSQTGIKAWESGQALFPHPFGPWRLPCRVEAWQPGLVCKFRDGLLPALLAWKDWQALKGLDRPLQALLDLLLAASPPSRFSPYACLGPGRGLFVGREEEISLILSPIPALVVSGESGMGKTSLFLRSARQAGTRMICCQAYTFAELRWIVNGMSGQGRGREILFLDEMDELFRDPRTLGLLHSLNRRGTAWRAAVHRPVKGTGPNYRLPPPRGLANLLLPLEKISGCSLEPKTKALILACAAGNPRRLQYLASQVLELMGQERRRITSELVLQAARRALVRGEAAGTVVGG